MAALPAALVLLGGCGNDLTVPGGGDDDGGSGTPPPPAALTLTVQDGDGQSGTVGEPLPVPLVVRVSADGDPVAGRGVVFEVESGEGSLAPDTAVTDGSGRATSAWTLGTAPGEQRVGARVIAADASVRFTAVAAAGSPDGLLMVSGDDQHGEAFETLPEPLVVRAVDRFGNPVPGVEVRWEVRAGRGEVSDEEVETDALGLAQVTWALGFSLGRQRVAAWIEGVDGSTVEFEADIF